MSEKKTGEILRESRVDWMIPNFLSLPHKTDDYVESPLFHFRDGTWYLVVYPSGKNKDIDSRFVTAYLRKKNPNIKTHGIQYRIGIKKKDGSEYVTAGEEAEFKDYQSESEDDEPQSEDDESQSEDEYEDEYEDDEYEDDEYEDDQSSRRVTRLVRRSALLANITVFLPRTALTIFCILRASKTGNKEADTHTEISIDGEKEKNSENSDDVKIALATLAKATGIDKLASDFKNLLTSEKDSDVILKVKNKEFRAHKNILRTRSSVFYAMFDHDMAEKDRGTVDIPDCDPEAFQYYLTYLYSASMDNLSDDIVFNLYFIADKYDAEELKHKCVEFMANNLSVDTFCNVVAFALQHEESTLLQTATDFFIKNTKEVLVSVQWQAFHKEYPVTANELYIKSFDYNVIQKGRR